MEYLPDGDHLVTIGVPENPDIVYSTFDVWEDVNKVPHFVHTPMPSMSSPNYRTEMAMSLCPTMLCSLQTIAPMLTMERSTPEVT